MSHRLQPRPALAGVTGPACAAPGVDPDWFFPLDDFEEPDAAVRHVTNQRHARYAAEVCGRCPVIDACTEAGKDDPFGIYGGKRPRARKAPRFTPEKVDVIAVERVVKRQYGYQDTVLNHRESVLATRAMLADGMSKLAIAERLGVCDLTVLRRERAVPSKPVFFDSGVGLVPDREGAA